MHLSHDHLMKRSRNLVDTVTHTRSPPIVWKMQYFQSQCQFQFQCLQITNIQPELCAFEPCSFCKSIQDKDQISIQFIRWINIFNWLNENNSFVECVNNLNISIIRWIKIIISLNAWNYFVEICNILSTIENIRKPYEVFRR